MSGFSSATRIVAEDVASVPTETTNGDAMEHVQLTIDLDDHAKKVDFPPHVMHLSIFVNFPEAITDVDARVSMLKRLGESIARQQLNRLTSLTIEHDGTTCFEGESMPAGFFETLVGLPALTELRSNSAISLEAVSVVRRMKRIRQLQVAPFTVEQLRRFVTAAEIEDAPMLQPMEIMPVPHTIDAEVAGLLMKLPTLTQLYGTVTTPDVDALLRGLPQLRDLAIGGRSGFGAISLDSGVVVSGLRSCQRLTSLRLNLDLTSSHIAECLPVMRNLTTLSITDDKGRLTDLEFLTHAPSTLTSLQLVGRRSVDPAEVRHLDRFQALTSLQLMNVFSGSLASSIRDRLQLGSSSFDSATWPRLTDVQLFE